MERVGPRANGVIAAGCWGSGLAVAGLGTMMHNLPAIYLGYGLLGGLGFAFGYISPVTNLIKWFPDKRGLATGLGVMAFGGGALLCAPLSTKLFAEYQKVPEMIGTVDTMTVINETGRKFVEIGGDLQEVVVTTAETVNNMPGLVDGGVYLCGSGDTGLSSTFLTLSAMYTGAMLTGALAQKSPAIDTSAEAAPTPVSKTSTLPSPDHYVPIDNLLKTPQFYLFWLGACGNAMAGVAIISCAKTIMGDVFGTQLPLIVDGAFAASYVAGISVANMGGRLGWAAASDKIGRRNAYLAFGAVGIPACLAIPQLTAAVSLSADPTYLWAFTGASCAAISCYGGLLGILPAYISDTFGIKNTPSIFGRLMTGWAAAALIGPSLLTYLRGSSYNEALVDLSTKVDPAAFQEKFGSGVENLTALVDAKAVTIPALMQIAPAGTIDPTCAIYDTSMYAMATALGGAFVCNYLVKPVDAKYLAVDKKDGTDQPQA